MLFVILTACTGEPSLPPQPQPTQTAPEPLTKTGTLRTEPVPAKPGDPAPEGTDPQPTDAADDPYAAPPEAIWEAPVPREPMQTEPSWPDPSIRPDQCSDMQDGGPVGKDGCVTADLKCGDRIVGHTIGGVQRFDGQFYQDKRCWPNTLNHDGGDERVYRLKVPPGEWRAWVTMYTPCADLTLGAMRTIGSTCPSPGSAVKTCKMSPKEGDMTERLELVSQTKPGAPAYWFVTVEGVNDEEGMFELVVECHPGVGGSVPKKDKGG